MFSTLEGWELHARGVTPNIDARPIRLMAARTRQHVEDQFASTKAAGFDILLIDTQQWSVGNQSSALGIADLVVVPATGVIEAACGATLVHDLLGFPENVFGLITGCRNGAAERAETRAAFDTHPVFQSELPWAEVLADLTRIGNIERFVASLACKSNELGYARYCAARDAWRAVEQLTMEVQWALKGHRLESSSTEQPVYDFQREAVA